MSKRALGVLVGGAALLVAVLPPVGSNAAEPTVCTWGGTPAETTGTLEIDPGLTLTPSNDPHEFTATGRLDGGPDCSGRMTFDGVIHAGATCANQVFEGKVRGLPGVKRFFGPGAAGVVHEFLYDGGGNVVGADQPQVLSGVGKEEGSEATDCNTAEGFTHGIFSSVVEIWG
jgi:hypothetical protein